MSFRLTPQHWLTLSFLIAAMVAGCTIYLALQPPMLDIAFKSDPRGRVFIDAVKPKSVNAGRVSPGMIVNRLGGVETSPMLLVEEPDNLESWGDYNRLMEALNLIDRAFEHGRANAVIDNRKVTLETRARSIADLPALFWLQVMVGSVSFLIATGVYAFRPREIGAVHFAVTGLGLLISASAAAVYSTREFVMNGDMVRLLSAINWLGTLGFTAALAALLWAYPKRSNSRLPASLLLYVTALISWAAFIFQLWPEPSTSYFAVIGLFAMTFVFAWMQWRRTQGYPVERAALKWYLLSIYLGTGLFAAVILLPVALDTAPVASQGLMFVVFLFMFVGIAFGITRYRLFELDRWWLSAWGWFLGGICVIALDMLLVWLIGARQDVSLALSLALVGWGWFPARQWLVERLWHRKGDRERQIHRLVQALFSSDEPEETNNLLQHYLAEEWAVLELQISPGRLDKPYIDENGQALKIPQLSGDRHLILRHPHHGSRLFNRHDRETARLLYLIATRAQEGLQERLKARDERLRILGDLHDDVGAKLLSLLHRSNDKDSSELARAALQDLRDIVSQPESGLQPITEALADWRAEAQDRLDGAGIRIEWHQKAITPEKVPAPRLRHCSRILREALNNIIRHANANTVWIRIEQQGNLLMLSVSDNGAAGDPKRWHEGRGMSNIRNRLVKLGGEVRWRFNEHGGCTLEARLPLFPGQ